MCREGERGSDLAVLWPEDPAGHFILQSRVRDEGYYQNKPMAVRQALKWAIGSESGRDVYVQGKMKAGERGGLRVDVIVDFDCQNSASRAVLPEPLYAVDPGTPRRGLLLPAGEGRRRGDFMGMDLAPGTSVTAGVLAVVREWATYQDPHSNALRAALRAWLDQHYPAGAPSPEGAVHHWGTTVQLEGDFLPVNLAEILLDALDGKTS